MAINDALELEKIVLALEARDVKLYHACQLTDFKSYSKLGGIPSRNKLLNSGLAFTAFDTDKIDKENKVWDKVFGNFSDFGREFTKQRSRSQPNPYGPIQLVFRPNALRSTTDLSITLRSAGARDFDRDKECLKNAQEVENIFQYSDASQVQNVTQKKNIAFSNELKLRFNRDDCTSPEFNCATKNELLSFDDVIYIVVDACLYKERELSEEIGKITNKSVHRRTYYCPEKESIIRELSKLSATYDCTQKPLITGNFASDELKAWVSERNDFHYNRFIRYLTYGTTRA